MRWNTYAAGTKLPAQQTGHEQIDRLRRAGITTGVFWMVIPYTTPELTRAALRHAEVCSDLDVREEKLARTLAKAGHQVMLLPVVR